VRAGRVVIADGATLRGSVGLHPTDGNDNNDRDDDRDDDQIDNRSDNDGEDGDEDGDDDGGDDGGASDLDSPTAELRLRDITAESDAKFERPMAVDDAPVAAGRGMDRRSAVNAPLDDEGGPPRARGLVERAQKPRVSLRRSGDGPLHRPHPTET
jgi:hypothetical protein